VNPDRFFMPIRFANPQLHDAAPVCFQLRTPEQKASWEPLVIRLITMKLKNAESVISWLHKRECVTGDTGIEIKKLIEVTRDCR
jgi:hypothetical protein